MASDPDPVTGIEELEKHLDKLQSEPDLRLDAKLFDHVELQLTESNIPGLIPRLLPRMTEILKNYRQDPAFLCSLTVKLLSPLTFTQVMSLASEEALIQAIRSPAPSASLMAIAILQKAAKTASETAILAATMKNVMVNFITKWLSAPEVEIGEKGSKALGDLLEIDCDVVVQGANESSSQDSMAVQVRRRVPGQGLMWRRIFHDRDIYGLLLSLCKAGPQQRSEEEAGRGGERQVTLAQGRLLRLLPRLAALNLAAVSHTDFADLNERFVQVAGDYGILQFAALHMVDEGDVLMHLIVMDFFETLLAIQRITPFSSYKMETLRKLLRDATARDVALKASVLSLHERTIPEEADDLKRFIGLIMR